MSTPSSSSRLTDLTKRLLTARIRMVSPSESGKSKSNLFVRASSIILTHPPSLLVASSFSQTWRIRPRLSLCLSMIEALLVCEILPAVGMRDSILEVGEEGRRR